jgi:hypothetical protein
MTSLDTEYNAIDFVRFRDGGLNAALATRWAFNGNTNILPSRIIQNGNGTITISLPDGTSHTFTGY